jgi:hypothetical protein
MWISRFRLSFGLEYPSLNADAGIYTLQTHSVEACCCFYTDWTDIIGALHETMLSVLRGKVGILETEIASSVEAPIRLIDAAFRSSLGRSHWHPLSILGFLRMRMSRFIAPRAWNNWQTYAVEADKSVNAVLQEVQTLLKPVQEGVEDGLSSLA